MSVSRIVVVKVVNNILYVNFNVFGNLTGKSTGLITWLTNYFATFVSTGSQSGCLSHLLLTLEKLFDFFFWTPGCISMLD
jgi:hypothetical protein